MGRFPSRVCIRDCTRTMRSGRNMRSFMDPDAGDARRTSPKSWIGPRVTVARTRNLHVRMDSWPRHSLPQADRHGCDPRMRISGQHLEEPLPSCGRTHITRLATWRSYRPPTTRTFGSTPERSSSLAGEVSPYASPRMARSMTRFGTTAAYVGSTLTPATGSWSSRAGTFVTTWRT